METIERFDVPSREALVKFVNDDLHMNPDLADDLEAAFVRWRDDRDFSFEDAFKVFDEILGGHGIESVDPEGAPDFRDEGIRMCPPFSYVNMGDSYAMTIGRDHDAGQWVFASWADMLEDCEKEHKLGDHEEFDEQPERCPSCHGTKFTLEEFRCGEWVQGPDEKTSRFVQDDATSYAYVCNGCNHHCQMAADFAPPEDDDENADSWWCRNCNHGPLSDADDKCPKCNTPWTGDDEPDDEPEETKCSTCGAIHDDDNHNHQ
jgi:hypothetical protein